MIVVVGTSHKTAPIDIRERLALPKEKLTSFLESLHRQPEIEEAFVISTCNRVEVYATTALAGDSALSLTTAVIEQALERQAGDVTGKVLHQHLFRYTADAAVRHLFRVTSSLDSLVVGEAQVLGQVKEAFDLASEAGTLGHLLGRALEWSFHVAKRVRSETQVGAGSVSVSSVAVELAKQIFGNLDRRTATLLGAGAMGEVAAKHLCDAGAKIVVVNRSLQRAQGLASQFKGQAQPWDSLLDSMGQTDIVIASTGSPDYVLTKELLAPIQRKRKGRSLFIIDIAVPRNIDPHVNRLDGVYLYDIDDLSKIAGETIRERFREAQISERIVAEEADAFDAWLDSRQVTPAIVALRSRVRSVLEKELERSLHGRLKHLGEQDRKALEGMLGAAVKKLTHHPTIQLKNAAAQGGARHLVDALQQLFDLGSLDDNELEQKTSTNPPPRCNHGDDPNGRESAELPPSRGTAVSNALPEEAS